MENNKKVHKVKIDRTACIGAATCVVLSPEMFELDEEGIAVVIGPAEGVDDDKLLMAAQSCPTQAIILYNKAGEQISP